MTFARPDGPPDWQDSPSGPIPPRIATARQSYEDGFLRLRGWVSTAMRLRHRVVARFGLTNWGAGTGEGAGKALMLSLPVLRETPEAYEVGLPDRHLTFTILTETAGGRASLTTSIWVNHWAGRLYLAVVLIPHKIIVKHALRGIR
ncbi:DUF2867 domain-containing protein [Marinovum sp.]|uniref:DUF2867 domain-containing protein n=1 Tax=Marinovum sp. TaxID=2024839 RepID=UPI002B279E4F|nr:DUF2867 domain-containing protein [Marinovum sp.]